jgi:anti-sigma B factor antagonist
MRLRSTPTGSSAQLSNPDEPSGLGQESSSLRRWLRPRGPVTFGLTKRTEENLTVLALTGEVDVLTVSKLSAELDQEVRRGTGDVVLDLREVEFVDSAGVHIMLRAQRRLARQSRALTVVCRPGPVRRVFELARVVEVLGVVPDLRDYKVRRARPHASREPATETGGGDLPAAES